MITKKVPFKAILLFLIVFSFSPNVQAQKVVRVQLSDIASLFKKKKSKDSKDSKDAKETNGVKEDEKNIDNTSGNTYDLLKTHIEAPPKSYTDLFYSSKRFSEVSKYLRKAIKENNTERAIGFLERGGLPYNFDVIGDDINSSGLFPAIDNKNYEILQAVYNKYPECIRFSQLLHYACSKDFDPKMIDWLVEHGASLDLNGYVVNWTEGRNHARAMYKWNSNESLFLRPIEVAFRYNQLETVDYLMKKYNQKLLPIQLSRSLVLNTEKKTEDEVIDLVKYWAQKGYGDPREYVNVLSIEVPGLGIKPDYPLVAAIREGKNKLAKLLIENYNADVNVETPHYGLVIEYESPLSLAVSKPGNLEMIDLLLSHDVKNYKNIIKGHAHREYREDFILRGLIE